MGPTPFQRHGRSVLRQETETQNTTDLGKAPFMNDGFAGKGHDGSCMGSLNRFPISVEEILGCHMISALKSHPFHLQ